MKRITDFNFSWVILTRTENENTSKNYNRWYCTKNRKLFNSKGLEISSKSNVHYYSMSKIT